MTVSAQCWAAATSTAWAPYRVRDGLGKLLGVGGMSSSRENEEFKVFLRHTKVPLKRKIEAIRSVLPELGDLARNLVALMVSRRMIDSIWRVEEEYHTLVDQRRGVERVKVYSAIPLEDSERERVSGFVEDMTGKRVILEAEVDKSVLGGLIIRVGDRLLDGSARSKLESLQQELETVSIGNGTQGYMEEAST